MNTEEQEQEPRDTSGWILGFPGRVWAVPALIIMGAMVAGGVPTLIDPSKGWTGYMLPVVLTWLFVTGIIEGLDEQHLRRQAEEQEGWEASAAEYEEVRTQPEPSSEPPRLVRLPEEPQPEALEAVTEERRAMRAAVQQQLGRRVEAGEFL